MALLDYDNDGWLDIYLLNGSTVAAFKGNEPPPRAMLFHNNHDGTFTDLAEKAGVTLGGWSAGPTWGDYDHDGLLDLFVPGYVKFDADHPPIAGQGTIPPNFCQFRGIAVCAGREVCPASAIISSTTTATELLPMSAPRRASPIRMATTG